MFEFVKVETGIKSGKFGFSGKMKIKPYSIPDDQKEAHKRIFMKFVKVTICGCWEWRGRIHNGYASCPTPGGNSKWAHRVSYALFNGPIAAQMHIDHTCRNPICVRPDHLEQKTPIENYLEIGRRKWRRDRKLMEEKGQTTIFPICSKLIP